MSADLAAAERFVLANARLLDRHRFAHLVQAGPVDPVRAALLAYRNDDGGFGHALEPDVRAAASETTSTLQALEVLAELGRPQDPMFLAAIGWLGAVIRPDGGVPFVLPGSAAGPHAPWMVVTDEGSHLTYGFAAMLWSAGVAGETRARLTAWCWDRLEAAAAPAGYEVKYALRFLDRVSDAGRADAAIGRLRPALRADGSLPVPGGTAEEALTPLDLSPRPDTRSRALFSAVQIERDLDALAAGQLDDGGWMFDWLAWSPAQSVEWRGALTVQAVATLRVHGRLPL